MIIGLALLLVVPLWAGAAESTHEAGAGRCLFHDDFLGSATPDPSRWDIVGAAENVGVTAGLLTVNVAERVEDTWGNMANGVRSLANFGPGTTFEAVSEYVATNQHALMLGASEDPRVHISGDPTDLLLIYGGTSSYLSRLVFQSHGNGVSESTPAAAQPSPGFHVWRMEWPVGGPIRFFQDGVPAAQHAVTPATDGLHIHLGGNRHNIAYTVAYERVSAWFGTGGFNPCLEPQGFGSPDHVADTFDRPGCPPPGWEINSDLGPPPCAVAGQARTGPFAVAIADVVAGAQMNTGMRSAPLAAAPGDTYFASAWVSGDGNGRVYLYVEFWDAGGVRLNHDGRETVATPGWARHTHAGTAPPGTVSVTMLVYSCSACAGLAVVDDVYLGRVDMDPFAEVGDGGEVDARASATLAPGCRPDTVCVHGSALASAGGNTLAPEQVHEADLAPVLDAVEAPTGWRPLTLEQGGATVSRPPDALVIPGTTTSAGPETLVIGEARLDTPCPAGASASTPGAQLVGPVGLTIGATKADEPGLLTSVRCGLMGVLPPSVFVPVEGLSVAVP